MSNNKAKANDYLSVKGRTMLLISRIFVYTILAALTFLCLFFFYLLFVNSTRSHGELFGGFTLMPSTHALENLKNAWTDDSTNIPRGMLNSFVIAFSSALLTTYFSALTAFGIHCYDFKLKKTAFTFILVVMMIPSQISAVTYKYVYNTANGCKDDSIVTVNILLCKSDTKTRDEDWICESLLQETIDELGDFFKNVDFDATLQECKQKITTIKGE